MAGRFGFGSFKVKGGVLPPEQEVETVLALRDRFPAAPLRLDPNACWSPATALDVARKTEGVLE